MLRANLQFGGAHGGIRAPPGVNRGEEHGKYREGFVVSRRLVILGKSILQKSNGVYFPCEFRGRLMILGYRLSPKLQLLGK